MPTKETTVGMRIVLGRELGRSFARMMKHVRDGTWSEDQLHSYIEMNVHNEERRETLYEIMAWVRASDGKWLDTENLEWTEKKMSIKAQKPPKRR